MGTAKAVIGDLYRQIVSKEKPSVAEIHREKQVCGAYSRNDLCDSCIERGDNKDGPMYTCPYNNKLKESTG